MHMDFSDLFHQSSKDRSGGGRVRIPFDRARWPSEWLTVQYKEYPRLKKLQFPEAPVPGGFEEILRVRSSSRSFESAGVSAERMAALLRFSCGIVRHDEEGARRAQPSGGSRYPIEVYPVVFKGGGVAPGVYHYNVRAHALDVLWERTFTQEDIGALFSYPWTREASMALFFTGVFERNQRKYGERGYRQILLEAGAIMQNAYLASAALDMKCCAIDGVREPVIEKLLDIDGHSESLICSMVLG